LSIQNPVFIPIPMTTKDQFVNHIHKLQDKICAALEEVDGKSTFIEDLWEREQGGGGKTRVIKNGGVFEKGGVNTSVVFGPLPEVMKQKFNTNANEFFACGLSLVLHPKNPLVPTVHANWRYFEMKNEQGEVIDSWFGGGTDLTPYYINETDCKHFHNTLKDALDPFGKSWYPKLKEACDEYFYNAHRNEGRGIGGIFYDYLRPDKDMSADKLFEFAVAAGESFIPSYVPIVENNMHKIYTQDQKEWQEVRRGRYVEFNLIHDRGTLFGLKTGGRIESILMSLPAVARWEYNMETTPESEEGKLVDVLQNPRNWV